MERNIIEALSHRYAVQVFDTQKKIPEEHLRLILESARLSPSSLGLEPWKFLVVQDTDLRTRLREVSFNQAKVTDASELIIICYRTDHEHMLQERLARTAETQHQPIEMLAGLRSVIENGIKEKVEAGTYAQWAKAQTYIPLGIMIETASLLGIDTGPMEGFAPQAVSDILHLEEKHLAPATMLALGYRGDDPSAQRPKTRRASEDVIEYL